MKDKLLRLLKAKEEARAALVAKSEKSEEVAELRSIHAQIESINTEIAELRGLIAEAETAENPAGTDDGQEDRTKVVNGKQQEKPAEARQFTPGKGFEKIDGQSPAEDRAAKELADKEKRGKDLMEGRSVTVASSSIVLPAQTSSTINPTFNVVSSLVDRVDTLMLKGGESFSQPYEKDTPVGGYTTEGSDYNEADVTFGYADITKAKITAYSETTEEIQKLPATDYESVVMNGISKSARRYLAKEILVGTGATNHLSGIFSTTATAIETDTDIELSAISNTTLSEIMFTFGGDEDVEDQAVLILNKVDLKAFSQLRTTDGKPFHTIITHGNTGTIDGVPYIINSACYAVSASATASAAYCMAYGPLSNYKLVIFSDLDVRKSDDYKFKTGQIAHRGSVFAGGNVVSYNGFLRVKKATTTTT